MVVPFLTRKHSKDQEGSPTTWSQQVTRGAIACLNCKLQVALPMKVAGVELVGRGALAACEWGAVIVYVVGR